MVDYEMQLTGWDKSYDDNNNFEFSVNPQVLNFPLTMDRDVVEMPYGLHHIIITGGGVKPRELVLTGTFHGVNRLSDFNGLSEWIIKKDMCRFWLNSTDFYYVVGSGVRQALSGEKVNFVDYVATLLAVSPFVYSTSRSIEVKNINSLSSDFVSGDMVNTGNASSVVKITVTNVGNGSVKKVVIGDSSSVAGSLHKVEWFSDVGLSKNDSVVIYPFKFFKESDKSEVRSIRLGHPEKSGVLFGRCKLPTGSVPLVKPKSSNQKCCVMVTDASGAFNVTVKFEWFDANVG